MLNFTIKTYEELTKEELYTLLQLRVEVFVVEQDCPYQDVDGKDFKALHVLGFKEKSLVAYTRIFAPGAYFDRASIGRVVVKKNARKYGFGKTLMDASIKAVREHYHTETIELSGQTYLKGFYNDLGFEQVGEGYLEDGIPHIRMVRE